MADVELIVYNVASFICALYVLEFGADTFIDHTTIVSRRTGISQAIIGLLTAGAEWEELVVVVASVARHRSSLAIGTIIGSSISNILGAFSLGLLFQSKERRIEFDRSAKVYALLSLLLTGLATSFTLVGERGPRKAFGGILLAVFVVYAASIGWAIGRGAIASPEKSDSEDSDSSGSESGDCDEETRQLPIDVSNDERDPPQNNEAGSSENPESRPLIPRHKSPRHAHSLTYHISQLLLGFLSICVSGYVLAHASSTISEQLGISDILFGVVILSIATTLPEKFIAVLSGRRGHAGILVANTVGSNIFLLTLCLGIVFVATAGNFEGGFVNAAEMGVLMGSTVVLTAVVWFGGVRWSRWVGALMLFGYLVFLGLEFTIIRRI